jgi:succinylglutamate desuccinylase
VTTDRPGRAGEATPEAGGPWTDRGGFWTVGSPERTEVAVVCCLHGDEPCGKLATERVLGEHGELEDVTFVLADPLAYERGQRYVDEDLNRAFPGTPDAGSHERRLAARLVETFRDHLVLDVHSTVSAPTPFALIGSRTPRVREAARRTGIGRVVDVGYVGGGMIGHLDGVAVEVDGADRRRGTDAAYRAILDFLGSYGLVEADHRRADPVLYRVYDDIPKSVDGLDLCRENFERVHEGEVFARGEGTAYHAGETFYPVLTSEGGYDDIYGFRAVREGQLSEQGAGDRPV